MGKRHSLGVALPVQKEQWFENFKRVSRNNLKTVLLESGRGGKYSIFGLSPVATLIGKNQSLLIEEGNARRELTGDPLQLMMEYLKDYETEHNPLYPDFQGGAIGFISYDYARYIEKLETQAEDDLQTPDLYFHIYDDVFVFDHENHVMWIITHFQTGEENSARVRLDELTSLWNQSLIGYQSMMKDEKQDRKKNDRDDVQCSFTESEFMNAVNQVKEYIAAGDVFQVNLSVRQSKPLESTPMEIYEALRTINPSPYMAYMDASEFQLVSASPELLVKKKGQIVSTRPIAGTRSRGIDEIDDVRLANELIENEKERAEHVMLVDLERNDLGRVCTYGSVEVNEFMVIEKYSHVMHIVSNVQGKLAEDKTIVDLVKATFPGGTITGAPKIRTMEIIEELEPVRRGVYTGSIGWIGFSKDMELNIAIRTMVIKDGITHVQAGAGIVIDSNPLQEYKESLKKAVALWKAKELSETLVKDEVKL